MSQSSAVRRTGHPRLTAIGAVDQESSPRGPTGCRDHLAGHVTECSPAKLGEVISNAARILGNASTG